MSDTDVIQAVTRLRCRPGDVLVITLRHRVSAAMIARMQETWKAAMKGTSIEGVKLVILEEADLALVRGTP